MAGLARFYRCFWLGQGQTGTAVSACGFELKSHDMERQVLGSTVTHKSTPVRSKVQSTTSRSRGPPTVWKYQRRHPIFGDVNVNFERSTASRRWEAACGSAVLTQPLTGSCNGRFPGPALRAPRMLCALAFLCDDYNDEEPVGRTLMRRHLADVVW